MSWETEKGVKYRNEYSRTNYDRFSVMFPKGRKVEYMRLATEQGQSLNAVINRLLQDWQQIAANSSK
jgi:hypothetical protein